MGSAGEIHPGFSSGHHLENQVGAQLRCAIIARHSRAPTVFRWLTQSMAASHRLQQCLPGQGQDWRQMFSRTTA
jgi:hypothetical protein